MNEAGLFLSNVLVGQLAQQSLRLAHHFLKNSSTSGPDRPLNLLKITWSNLWGNHVSQHWLQKLPLKKDANL